MKETFIINLPELLVPNSIDTDIVEGNKPNNRVPQSNNDSSQLAEPNNVTQIIVKIDYKGEQKREISNFTIEFRGSLNDKYESELITKFSYQIASDVPDNEENNDRRKESLAFSGIPFDIEKLRLSYKTKCLRFWAEFASCLSIFINSSILNEKMKEAIHLPPLGSDIGAGGLGIISMAESIQQIRRCWNGYQKQSDDIAFIETHMLSLLTVNKAENENNELLELIKESGNSQKLLWEKIIADKKINKIRHFLKGSFFVTKLVPASIVLIGLAAGLTGTIFTFAPLILLGIGMAFILINQCSYLIKYLTSKKENTIASQVSETYDELFKSISKQFESYIENLDKDMDAEAIGELLKLSKEIEDNFLIAKQQANYNAYRNPERFDKLWQKSLGDIPNMVVITLTITFFVIAINPPVLAALSYVIFGLALLKLTSELIFLWRSKKSRKNKPQLINNITTMEEFIKANNENDKNIKSVISNALNILNAANELHIPGTINTDNISERLKKIIPDQIAGQIDREDVNQEDVLGKLKSTPYLATEDIQNRLEKLIGYKIEILAKPPGEAEVQPNENCMRLYKDLKDNWQYIVYDANGTYTSNVIYNNNSNFGKTKYLERVLDTCKSKKLTKVKLGWEIKNLKGKIEILSEFLNLEPKIDKLSHLLKYAYQLDLEKTSVSKHIEELIKSCIKERNNKSLPTITKLSKHHNCFWRNGPPIQTDAPFSSNHTYISPVFAKG